MEDIFNARNKIADVNWIVLKTVGERTAGTVKEIYTEPARDEFGPQRVFKLEMQDGSLKRIGLSKDNSNYMAKTDDVQLGDILGLELIELVPAKKRGFNDFKKYEIYRISKGERNPLLSAKGSGN